MPRKVAGSDREEYRILRNMVKKFVENELQPYADEWEAEKVIPKSVFSKMGELGLLGMHYSEAYGGQDMDYFATIVLVEELVRCNSLGLVTAVTIHSDVVLALIHEFGKEKLKEQILIPAIKGQMIGSIAITEANTGSDVARIQTVAKQKDNEWIIDGSKMFITNGVISDFTIVLARTSPGEGANGMSIFLVEKNRAGFSVSKKLDKVGLWGSDTAELIFEECIVPDDHLIGEEGKGFGHIMWQFQGERLVTSAVCVAASEYILQLAIKYMKQRTAFSTEIINFQALRHRIADLAAQIEAVRSLVYSNTERFIKGENPATEISMAKMLAAQLINRVSDEALQFHGGYGYMMEYLIQRFWRDARAYRIAAGTDEVMREIISRAVIKS